MKKFLMLLISFIMIFMVSIISLANETDYTPVLIATNDLDTIKVMQDGEYIDFRDNDGNSVEPQIINGRTMVPFRKIFNSLGVSDENISWSGETRTVTAVKNDLKIELQIENNIAKKIVDGDTSTITLDQAPVIVDGRTLVPVRFIAESMNMKVGWDSVNRTVIIIDDAKFIDDLEKALPKYMEMLNEQTTALNTFDITMNIDGKVNYSEKGKSSSKSEVKITGTINMVKSEDAISMDINLKFSGKGALYNTLKENDITKIDFNFILKDNKIYMKSSLLDKTTKGKWVVSEEESIKNIFELYNKVSLENNMNKLFEINENDLNIYSYEALKVSSDVLKQIFNDKNIKVSGNTTKKYEITVDLLKVIEYMNLKENDIDNLKNAKMKITSSIKDGVNQNSNSKFEMEIAEENEKIDLELNINSKVKSYNKTYKIDVPSKRNIME